MKRVVRGQRLGYVATVCPDGTPNLSPKGTVTVWDDEHLIFADIHSPRTIANPRKNPAVEINVVDPFVRKGYRFKGTGEILTVGELFNEILNIYQHDVRDAKNRVRSIVLVKIEHASALISPAYDNDSTEQAIIEQWKGYFEKLNRGIIPAESPD